MTLNNHTLHVAGLRCGGCVKGLQQTLQTAFGDQSVHIDLASGLLQINNTTLTAAEIRRTLENKGYTVSENPPQQEQDHACHAP